jgi:hypothetical protein
MKERVISWKNFSNRWDWKWNSSVNDRISVQF